VNSLKKAYGRARFTFKYDPFGRRIYKSSYTATSVYAYDGDNLVEETNSAGTVVARYEQTQNIDGPLAMLRSFATSYFHADGLGSITSLSNSAGSIANTYTYDSLSKLTASTGSLVNPFQYTARESDSETGLYYYRARYYDPSDGRFLSEDPIGFAGGANFYAYVTDSPINLTDPSGFDPGCYKTKCVPRKYLPPIARLGLFLMSKASKATGNTFFFGLQGAMSKTKIAGVTYGVSGVWATDPQGNVGIVYSFTLASTVGTPGLSGGLQIGAATYQNFYDGLPGASWGKDLTFGDGLLVGGGYASNSAGVATYATVGAGLGRNIDVNTHALSYGAIVIPLCPE
jgi:RHS repeat-associated protein